MRPFNINCCLTLTAAVNKRQSKQTPKTRGNKSPTKLFMSLFICLNLGFNIKKNNIWAHKKLRHVYSVGRRSFHIHIFWRTVSVEYLWGLIWFLKSQSGPAVWTAVPSWVSPLSLLSTPEGRSGPPPALHRSLTNNLSCTLPLLQSFFFFWVKQGDLSTLWGFRNVSLLPRSSTFSVNPSPQTGFGFAWSLCERIDPESQTGEEIFSPDERVDGAWDELFIRGLSLHLGGILLHGAAPVLRSVLHHTPRLLLLPAFSGAFYSLFTLTFPASALTLFGIQIMCCRF